MSCCIRDMKKMYTWNSVFYEYNSVTSYSTLLNESDPSILQPPASPPFVKGILKKSYFEFCFFIDITELYQLNIGKRSFDLFISSLLVILVWTLLTADC